MRILFKPSSLFLVLSLVWIGACSSPDSSPEQEVATPTNEATVENLAAKGQAFVVFGHEVSDYALWRSVHDELSVVRDEYGITDSYIMQGADEDSVVWMISSAPSAAAAHDFMVDPNLARLMDTEGVEGEIYRSILAPGFVSSLNAEDFPNRIIVQHSVRDFDMWKRTFDGHVASRERAGLVDLFVSHPIDNEGDVHMMFGVWDPEKVVEYMGTPSLRAAMRLAGVTGEPRAYFVRKAN